MLDKQDESVERLLPAFYRAAPTLAALLIDQALQAGLLTAEVVRHLRRHEVDAASKR